MAKVPDVDFDAIGKRLIELTRIELTEFCANTTETDFYGFFFDCNSDYGNILLCLNTVDSLENTARSYKERHPDETLDQLRNKLTWNPGDWKYQGFQSGKFDMAWEPISQSIEQLCEALLDDERDEEFGQVCETFMAVVGLAAIELEVECAFEHLPKTDDFQVCWADHDETFEDSLERMKLTRNLHAEMD